jgi:hypothetical protein
MEKMKIKHQDNKDNVAVGFYLLRNEVSGIWP